MKSLYALAKEWENEWESIRELLLSAEEYLSPSHPFIHELTMELAIARNQYERVLSRIDEEWENGNAPTEDYWW